MKRKAAILAALAIFFLVILHPFASDAILIPGAPQATTQLPPVVLQDVMDSTLAQADGVETGSGCTGAGNQETVVVSSGRKGDGYKHTVAQCGERAELRAHRDVYVGDTLWMAWSMKLDSNFSPGSLSNIVNQWSVFPTQTGTTFPCGGVGHKITINSTNWRYDLQYSSNSDGNSGGACTQTNILSTPATLGKWVDFIQYAKWTGDTDGFLKLWARIEGEPGYTLVLDYTGRTWWNNEGRAPQFKMGLYTGDPGWTGSTNPNIVYTDEFRQSFAGRNECIAVATDPSVCVSSGIAP